MAIEKKSQFFNTRSFQMAKIMREATVKAQRHKLYVLTGDCKYFLTYVHIKYVVMWKKTQKGPELKKVQVSGNHFEAAYHKN